MGQSHIDSNMIAKDGTEYIASFNAIKSLTSLQVDAGTDSSYIKIGAQQYIFVGNSNTEATVLAEATALVGANVKGSLYLGRKGNMWFYVSDTAASPVQALA